MKTKEEAKAFPEDIAELSEEELQQVSGGLSDERFAIVEGEQYVVGVTQKTGYCKYCNGEKLLTYIGTGTGWDSVMHGMNWKCNLWKCTECNKDNYYTCSGGRLIE